MSLVFHNVSWQLQQDDGQRTILDNVHGRVEPGEMLAIMGKHLPIVA